MLLIGAASSLISPMVAPDNVCSPHHSSDCIISKRPVPFGTRKPFNPQHSRLPRFCLELPMIVAAPFVPLAIRFVGAALPSSVRAGFELIGGRKRPSFAND